MGDFLIEGTSQESTGRGRWIFQRQCFKQKLSVSML